MVCTECKKGKIVLHAFSHGKCEKCECGITTEHVPCNKVCDKCSDEYKVCKECGVTINE